jgi:hypothetical protein
MKLNAQTGHGTANRSEAGANRILAHRSSRLLLAVTHLRVHFEMGVPDSTPDGTQAWMRRR